MSSIKPGRSWDWLKCGLALWVALAVAVTAKTLFEGDRHSVYQVFASASQHWWADRSLYDVYEGIDLYRYSPTFAVAFTPFALLPPRFGNLLWNLSSLALLFLSLRMLIRHVLPGEWPPWREGVFLGLVALGSVGMIWPAQSNALLIALVGLSAVAMIRQRWWTASFLLAAPVFIKFWPIALVLLCMACWPRRLFFRFPVAASVFAAVPFLSRPFDTVVTQYHNWYTSLVVHQQRWPGFRDVWTIWEELSPPVNRLAYVVLQLGAALGVLGWCWWQRHRTQSTAQLLTWVIAIWLCWQLLLGPGTEQVTYGIITPSLAWALCTSRHSQRRDRVLVGVAFAVVSLFTLGDIETSVSSWIPFAKAILPSGVVLFTAWLVLFESLPLSTARNKSVEWKASLLNESVS